MSDLHDEQEFKDEPEFEDEYEHHCYLAWKHLGHDRFKRSNNALAAVKRAFRYSPHTALRAEEMIQALFLDFEFAIIMSDGMRKEILLELHEKFIEAAEDCMSDEVTLTYVPEPIVEHWKKHVRIMDEISEQQDQKIMADVEKMN